MLAEEVPKNRRITQICCAILWCLLSAGPVFGFAALKPVLISENVYADLCTAKEVQEAHESATPGPLCAAQDLRLNYMFTLAAVITNVAAFVIGGILDNYGPRVCGLIGASFILAASLLLANAASVSLLDPYLFGYTLLALGGPFTFISSYHLSNAFPLYSGTILALLTGAFDTSSAVFLVYRIVYEKTLGGVPLSRFFAFYTCVPLFIYAAELLVMPSQSYKTNSDIKKLAGDAPVAAIVEEIESEQQALQASAPTETRALLDIAPGPAGRSLAGSLHRVVHIPSDYGATDIRGSIGSLSGPGSPSGVSGASGPLAAPTAPSFSYVHSPAISTTRRVSYSTGAGGSPVAINKHLSTLIDNFQGCTGSQDVSAVTDDEFIASAIQEDAEGGSDVPPGPAGGKWDVADASGVPADGNHPTLSGEASEELQLQKKITEYEQQKEDALTKFSGVFGVLHGKPLKQQFLTPWFVLMCLFTTIQMLRINYFVATVHSQYLYMLNSAELATKVNRFFDVALPVGGVVSIPMIGLLLDKFSTLVVLSVLLGCSLLIGVLGMVPDVLCAEIGIVVLVLYRPFYYTAVSDFCAKVFGFDTFGTIYGTIICFSGLMNLTQTYLDAATHDVFGMNPLPVNVMLVGVTGVVGLSLIVFVGTEAKSWSKKKLHE